LVDGATFYTDGPSLTTDSAMHALLLRLATQLPPPARRIATPARISTLVQFLMFGTVGAVGFVADTATVYSLRHSLGLYAVLVTFVPLCAAEPVWAVAAGAVAGMFLNFSLSRSMVFR
jgi:hypothetical protein